MKSVGQKMFLKSGKTLRLISAPKSVAELLGDHEATVLPPRSKQPADVVLIFARNRTELESRLGPAKLQLAPGGVIWVAYPKGTSKLASDIHRDIIREYAAALGLETVSLIAMDEDWSCMRLKVVE